MATFEEINGVLDAVYGTRQSDELVPEEHEMSAKEKLLELIAMDLYYASLSLDEGRLDAAETCIDAANERLALLREALEKKE